MSRSQASDERIRQRGARPLRCDLSTVTSEQLETCEVVVHCAAYVGEWGTREQYWSVNVLGTQRLLDEARAAGVRRFLYLSSEAALFHGQDMVEIDESYSYPESTPFLYSETKAEAERRVLAANNSEFETLAVRPRMVWGPGDRTILPAVEEMVDAGQFMWINGGRARTSTTHIENLVHGVELAVREGRGGEVYFITDEGTISLRRFLTALLNTQGVTPPERSIPAWLARAVTIPLEATWRLLSLESEPPLTRLAVELMARECTIRIDKARRELGYDPVISREQGLAELKAAS